MPAEVGHRVGPYELVETLGSGGMGTVFLAHDVRLDRRVALKFIHEDRVSPRDPDAQDRLLHEARAASALNHPNICQVYDVGGEGRESWIAMEFVEGEPLSSVIRSRGPLTPPRVIQLGSEIATALAHAHQRGVLHCDLKPANIVCDRAGHVKLLDFGIARRFVQDVAREITHTTVVPASRAIEGTMAYMAPEVIRGEAPSERSDLWSLGTVLYEMLIGAPPFQGQNLFDLAAGIVHGPALQVPASVPTPLAHVVARLLSRNPYERYATAAEAAAALEALNESRPRALSMWPAWAVGLALLLAIVAVVWLLRQDSVLQLAQQRLISTTASSPRTPAFSPDGSMVAYVAPDGAGVQQVWLQQLEGGAPAAIQVTSGKAHASRPRWLANGQIIYAMAGQGIWAVAPLGGTPTRLIERGANPNVARDGSRIVFEDQRAIWTASPDGSDLRRVDGTQPLYYPLPMAPALSPDGTTIAYFHAELGPNGDFWTIPARGGTPKRLTSDRREGGWPVWTHDGRAIIFSSARAGSRTLWQIPAGAGEPMPLTTGAGEDDQPDITADGGQLAYTSVRNTWELRVKELGSGQDRALLQRGVEVLFPMFSPDGQRLTYFGRSDFAVAIFTIGVDGSAPLQLTAGRELNHQPRWGADGHEVFFFQHYPTVSFRRVAALGGPSAEFRSWDWQTAGAPYFDPSGRYLAYLRQRPLDAPRNQTEHTVIHEVATGEERVWPEPHTHVSGWSPDGMSIVGWQHEAKTGNPIVTICRVADGACRAVTTGATPRWSAHDGRIYFVRPAASALSQELWTVAPDGTGERNLGHLGAFRPIDVFFDVSKNGLLAWAPLRAGEQQLWTATIGR